MKLLVFDTSPVSGFTMAGELDLLETVTQGYQCVMTMEVARELEAGAERLPVLKDVFSAEWLEIVSDQSIEYFSLFAGNSEQLLGRDDRNLGECSTIAYAEHHGGVAVLDDQTALNFAIRRKVVTSRSLWLLVNALERNFISEQELVRAVDGLVGVGVYLPFKSGASFLREVRSQR